MKRMIISPTQLKAINEAVIYNVDTSMAGINTAYAAAKDKPEAKNGINFHITDSPVNTSNGEESTAIATSPEDLTNAADSYNNIRIPGQQNESRFSKRQVELGRMLEMRRTGKVFSKRQLNEMFMETQKNAYIFDEFFNGPDKKPIRKILDGVKEYFPEGFDDFLEAVKNGSDIPTYIKENFFTSVNSDAEEKFLKKIGAIE